jgi:hypothetical protein
VYRKHFKIYPESERTLYAKNIFSYIKDDISTQDKILEVGAGDGILSSLLRDGGYQVHVSEMDPSLRNLLHEKQFLTYENFLDMKNENFDVIISTDVLEHILEPKEYYKKCIELNASTIILQVPVNRGTQYNEMFDGHFHYFNVDALQRLFDGYNMIRYKLTGRGFSARGTELLITFRVDSND